MRLLLLLLLLLGGCISKTSIIQEAPAVAEGDIVLLNYIGRVDTGELVSTSYEDLAKDSDIAKAENFEVATEYGPINLTIGSGMMPSIERAALGMHVDEKKDIVVPPKEAYGERSPKLIRSIPRIAALPKITEVPLEQFEVTPIEGEYIELKYWSARILEVTNESVVLRNEPENGSTIQTDYGPALVVVNDTHVITILTPEIGSTVATRFGNAKVIAYDESTITLDHNHPLAGKTLLYTIRVEGIEKAR
ncbi:MAG: FKBP-type peptidyl-prolyl cis-trans isomerase [Candidatus Hydrothermarchaeales archaeon]